MMNYCLKIGLLSLIMLSGTVYPVQIISQDTSARRDHSVYEMDHSIFMRDKYWRGADGAASINLGAGKILWLFSDTFIDTKGTGKRSNATMIRNSIAIQNGTDLETADISFYYKGGADNPDDFFKRPGRKWFWTGHGALIDSVLAIFLFEEKKSRKGLGFQAVGWQLAIIDNPTADPQDWNITYYKGPDRYKVLAGSSAILINGPDVLAYAVGYYNNNQDVYLLRYSKEMILRGELSEPAWYVNGKWINNPQKLPCNIALFQGQTEFSVHFQRDINKYIQIQTVGFGQCPLGYRMADSPWGPWSELVSFYMPEFSDLEEFNYSANAHPELVSDGIIVTYNVNNFNFGKLVNNEEIYFPKIIRLYLDLE